MPSVSSWSLSFPEPDIALATVDTPSRGVNLLSHAVLDELDALLDQLVSRGGLAGLIVASGKPGTFIAGADLTQIAKALSLSQDEVRTRSQRGQAVLGRLAQVRFGSEIYFQMSSAEEAAKLRKQPPSSSASASSST